MPPLLTIIAGIQAVTEAIRSVSNNDRAVETGATVINGGLEIVRSVIAGDMTEEQAAARWEETRTRFENASSELDEAIRQHGMKT